MGESGGERYCGAYRALMEGSIVDDVFRPVCKELKTGDIIGIPDYTIIRVGGDHKDGFSANYYSRDTRVPYMEVLSTPPNENFDPGVIIVLPLKSEEVLRRNNAVYFIQGGRCFCILNEGDIIELGSVAYKVGLHQEQICEKKTPFIEVLSPDPISRKTSNPLSVRRTHAMLASIGQKRICSHYLSCKYVPSGVDGDVSIRGDLRGLVNIPDKYVNDEIARRFPTDSDDRRGSLREYLRMGRIISLEAFPCGLDSKEHPIGIGESARILGDRLCKDIRRLSGNAIELPPPVFSRRCLRLLMYYGIVLVPRSSLTEENIHRLSDIIDNNYDVFGSPDELIIRVVNLLNQLGAGLDVNSYLTQIR